MDEIDYNEGIDRGASNPFDVMGASSMAGGAASFAKSNDMLGKSTSSIGAQQTWNADGAIDTSAKGSGMTGAKGASIVGDSMAVLSQGAAGIKDIGLSTTDRMDAKGATTHKVDAGGKIVGMGAAGAKLGSNFGPWGTAIGGAAGAVTGGALAALDAFKQPDASDANNQRNRFDMGLQIGAIQNNDTQPQQVQAAAQGRKEVEGTKQFEVEKDEIVLRKIGRIYKKVADFKGGKSHAEGGEDYIANDGDVIMPGKKRLQVDKALRTRDWKKIESMRQALPADSDKMVAEKGVKSVDSKDKSPDKRTVKWDKFLAQPGVKEKIKAISKKHGFSPARLMAVIEYETAGSLDPSQTSTASSATGLIQFMDASAKELGTTTAELAKMDALEQLDWVDKYYDKHHKYGDDPYDTVIASGAGKLNDDSILYPKGSKEAKANPSWQNENGDVTKASARKAAPSFDDYEGFGDSEPQDTYEQYVAKVEALGQEPQTEEWYKANVINASQGVNPSDSSSFEELKRKAEAEGSPAPSANPRGDATTGDSVATMSDKEFDAKMRSDTKFRGMYNAGDAEAQQARVNSVIGGISAGAAVPNIPGFGWVAQKFDIAPRVANATEIAKSWLKGDMGAVPEGTLINTQEVGYTDGQLAGKLDKFVQYLQGDVKGNGPGLDVTNSMMDGMREYNKWQAAVTAGQDTKGSIPNIIAEIFAGESPETIKKWIDKGVSEGVLDRKTAWVVRNTAEEPEKYWTGKMKTNLGVDIALIATNPKGVIDAIKSGGRIIGTGGKVIAKSAPEFFKMLKSMKGAKAITKKIAADVKKGIVGSAKYSKDMKLEDLTALGQKLDDAGVPIVGTPQGTTAKSWTESFSDTWSNFSKLPEKTRELYTGHSVEDLTKASNKLLEATGKTSEELMQMSKTEVGTLLKSRLDESAAAVTKASEARMDALSKVTSANQELKTARKSLAEVRAQRGPKDTLEKSKTLVKRAEETLSTTKSELKTAYSNQELVDTNWNQIGKFEDLLYEGGQYKDKFRTLVKMEETIAKNFANIEKLGDVDADIIALGKRQARWANKLGEGIMRADNATDATGKVIKAEDILHEANVARTEAMAGAKTATKAEGAAITKGVNLNKLMNETPELLALVEKDAAIMNQLKNGTITAAKLMNVLRDRGGDKVDLGPLEDAAKVETQQTTPDVIDTTPTPEDDARQKEISEQIGGAVSDYTAPKTAPAEIPAGDAGGGKGERKIGERIAGGFSNLASYAPAIYNIVKGLESPERVQRRFVTPQTRVFQPMAQPQLNAIENAFSASVENARNLSGGSVANFRSNAEKAWADKIARTGQVNAQEASRADQVAGENIGIRNQADQYNTAANTRYDEIDMKSKAATNSFLAQGVQDVANIASRNKTDRLKEASQTKMMKLMNTGNYKYNSDTGEVEFAGNVKPLAKSNASSYNPDFNQGETPTDLTMPDLTVNTNNEGSWIDNFKFQQ